MVDCVFCVFFMRSTIFITHNVPNQSQVSFQSCSFGIIEIYGQIINESDLSVGGAGVSSVVAVVTRCVLQTETGLVSLCYSSLRTGFQQVIMTELVHAVVVPGNSKVNQVIIMHHFQLVHFEFCPDCNYMGKSD